MKLEQIQNNTNVVKQIKRLLYDHLGPHNVTQQVLNAANNFGPPFTHTIEITGNCDSNYQVDQIGEDVEQILQQAGFDGQWSGRHRGSSSRWVIQTAKGTQLSMINKFYFSNRDFDEGVWDNSEVVLWIPVIRK